MQRVRPWLRAVRPHQWAKNLLVFVPPLLSGASTEMDQWLGALAAFVMISALASAGYVFNDLLDIEADRRHPSKRRRPFAAGELGVRDGLGGIVVLLVGAALAGLFLEPTSLLLGAAYFGTSALYSLWLKRLPMFDVVTLAGLFTLRILIGITAADVPMSFWLLTFSMLFFLSLAMVKRYTELREHTSPERPDLEHRGYTAADMPLLLAFGSAAAMASLTVFVVYLRDEQFDENVYSDPSLLWLVFPVLTVWTMRVWHLALHGRMHDDPILFALYDRVSHLLGAACLVCIALAW